MRFLTSRPRAFITNLVILIRAKKFRHALAHVQGNMEALACLPKLFFKRLRIRVSGNIEDGEMMKWFCL